MPVRVWKLKRRSHRLRGYRRRQLSDPTPDWRAADGADAYPEDPARWILEPEEEGALFASSNVLIGGGVGLVVVLALIGLIMRGRRPKADDSTWQVPPNVGMPDFGAQPAAVQPGYAAPVAMPDFGAQPAAAVAQPAYAAPVAPVTQPDPAREYYNSLIAQGYPHEDAVRYTQQYFAQFHG